MKELVELQVRKVKKDRYFVEKSRYSKSRIIITTKELNHLKSLCTSIVIN